MRSIVKTDTLQIEWTAKCVLSCSNCTHFSGSYVTHPELCFEQFKEIIDSLEGFPRMIGAIGGEPTLNKDFVRMAEYQRSKFPREQLGLWSVFPKGKEHLREVIVECFGNILLNDHTLPDIMHAPILVGIEEVIKDEKDMWLFIDDCWIANSWSPVVNSKGAFFCEVAGSMAQLFDGPDGWKVEPGWWKKTPKDYREQMQEYCTKCGCAAPLTRRASVDGRDDISPKNLERLQGKDRKIDKGRFVVSDLQVDESLMKQSQERGTLYPVQKYKDEAYRKGIAARFGIGLRLNQIGYWDPYLLSSEPAPPPSLFKILNERYA